MRHAICLLLLLAAPAIASESVYTWRSRDDDPDRVYLYRDGKQIGGWCYRAKHYRPLDGDTWGPPSDAAPVPPPDKTSISMSKIQQSPPRRRLLRPLQSRIDAGVQAALQEYAEKNAARWAGEVIGRALNKAVNTILYGLDLGFSAKLFAHIEMGGKLNDNTDSDDYKFTKELMTSGSARVFLSEKAKFADKLRREEFSDAVLSTIFLDVVDDDPIESKETGARADGEFRSVLLSRTRDWKEDPPPTVAPDAPSVLVIYSHRAKDAKDKIPVTVHCSLMYLAQKEGKTFAKALHFDLYLEKLETQGDWYPWKVKNVEYK